MKELPVVLVLAFGLFFGSLAWASPFNYRPVLPGERAAGMGGAYTALSDTAEGGFYNPGGLAFIDRNNFSVSGNIYRFVRGERKGALNFAGSQTDLPQDAFTSIPQIAAYVQKIRFPWESKDSPRKNAIALSIITADQAALSGQVELELESGNAAGTRLIADQTLLVGPSYARRLNDRLALGVTVFYMLQQTERTAFLVEDSSDVFGQAFLHIEQTIGNLLARIGARYSPLADLWLGLTYQTPALRLHSSGLEFFSGGVERSSDDSSSHTVRSEKNLKPREEWPQYLSLGAAYGPKGRWILSASGMAHLPDSYNAMDGPDASRIEQETVFNFSVGGEYYITSSVPVRAGFFSDFSSAQDVTDGSGADKIDNLGGSLAFAMEQENTTVSLGGIFTFGSGDGIDNLGNRIDVTSNTYSILLSGSFKF